MGCSGVFHGVFRGCMYQGVQATGGGGGFHVLDSRWLGSCDAWGFGVSP